MFDPHQVWQYSFKDIDHEIFSTVLFPSADSRRAVVSFWQKNVHKYWLTAWRIKPAQKQVLGKLTRLDMTQMGLLGCKTSTQTEH